MSEVRIDGKYILTNDSLNIIVKEIRFDDNGVELVTPKTLGNYGVSAAGRAAAYRRLVNCAISDSEASTLQEILDVVQSFSERIESTVVNFK